MVTIQTQFGEDRCTQFRVIVLTDPHTQTHTHTHTKRQDRLQCTAPLASAQCNQKRKMTQIIVVIFSKPNLSNTAHRYGFECDCLYIQKRPTLYYTQYSSMDLKNGTASLELKTRTFKTHKRLMPQVNSRIDRNLYIQTDC